MAKTNSKSKADKDKLNELTKKEEPMFVHCASSTKKTEFICECGTKVIVESDIEKNHKATKCSCCSKFLI